MVQSLQLVLLLFGLLPDTHQFIEQNGGLLLCFDLVSVVLAELRLHEISHLTQF